MNVSVLGPVFLRIFIFVLGLLLVLPALNKLYVYSVYRVLGNEAYGIVDHPGSGRDFGGRPIIKYTDSLGADHEFKSKAKTHLFYRPEAGEKIKIFIDRSNPQKVIVDNRLYYVILPLMFLVAGCACCQYAIFGNKKFLLAKRSSLQN